MSDKRVFAGQLTHMIDDFTDSARQLCESARQDPQAAFDAALEIKEPAAYAALAGVYRTMIEQGEGDSELVTELWNQCLAKSAGYLGIEFPKDTSGHPKMAAKLRKLPKRHGGVYRRK